MKAPTSTALVALSSLPLLPAVLAAVHTFPVTLQPIKALFNIDGSHIHYDFLDSRFLEHEGKALEFKRKRDLSGVGSRRSHRQCSDGIKGNKPNVKGLGDLIGGVVGGVAGVVGGVVGGVGNAVGGLGDAIEKLPHFVDGRWMHDRRFGVVIAKAENEAADNEWLVDVTLGTPGQAVQVVFDTGSPEAWVYSPQCCYGNNHSWFDPTLSKTFTNRTVVGNKAVRAPPGTPGQDFNVQYASGTATKGYVGVDTFGFQQDKFKVPDLSIALATNLTGSRSGRQMDGLIGLSSGIGTQVKGNWTTPFEAMSQRGMLDQNYLTATLQKADRETGKGGGGRYVFGEVDEWQLEGDIEWDKVLSAYFWAGYFANMTVGDVVLAAGSGNDTNPIRYLVDTGTATITMPPAMAKAANKAIHGSFKTDSKKVQLPWLVPCDTGLKKYEKSLGKKRNRPLSLGIKNATFSIPLQDHVFFPQYPVPAREAGGRKNMCYSAIQEGLPSLTVLGLSFIKNHVLVFDQGGKDLSARRVGFGKRRDVKYDV